MSRKPNVKTAIPKHIRFQKKEKQTDESEEIDKPKPRKKKPKKKRHHKLPNKIVVFPNDDKGSWVEKWDCPVNRSIGCLPHSFRLIASGSVGRGKTLTIANLFLQHQSTNRPFKKLYICCCSLNSKEWLKLEPTAIMTTLPDPDMFDGSEKICLILDDFEMERAGRDTMRKLSTLFRFSSTHCNLSIMASYQVFFSIPSVMRKCASHFLIYKPNSIRDQNTIANRIGMDPEDLRYIFKNVCKERYDSFMIDLSADCPPKWRYRRNVFEPIELVDDEDENRTTMLSKKDIAEAYEDPPKPIIRNE